MTHAQKPCDVLANNAQLLANEAQRVRMYMTSTQISNTVAQRAIHARLVILDERISKEPLIGGVRDLLETRRDDLLRQLNE